MENSCHHSIVSDVGHNPQPMKYEGRRRGTHLMLEHISGIHNGYQAQYQAARAIFIAQTRDKKLHLVLYTPHPHYCNRLLYAASGPLSYIGFYRN